MDTDDLSEATYKGIILESEKFNHDLTLQFGLLASSCKNESEYLMEAKKLIGEIQNLDESYFADLFFDSPPPKKALQFTLEKILGNISKMNQEKCGKQKRK